MAYARWEGPVQDSAGNLIEDVWVEVRDEDADGNPLATDMFSDRDGASPLDNPFHVTSGLVGFHIKGGCYSIRIYGAGYDQTFRYIGIGTGSEGDITEGTGDVTGPDDSVDGEVAVFDGTGGKTIKRGGLLSAMWATMVHALTAKTTPADNDEIGILDSAASYVGKRLTFANLKTWLDTRYALVGSGPQSICEGRLTTESGVAISTSDRTAQTTIYFTPFRGNKIGLYSGSAWSILTFTQLSLSLSGFTSGKPYDIFVYNNSGTPTLEALVWTNDTTRATALTTQDGVLVKSGATTRRYLGTIYTTATGQTEDSLAKRMVWNYYNRVPRPMAVVTTSGGSYATSSWRQFGNSSANQLDFVLGVAEDEFTAQAALMVGVTSGNNSASGRVGIGIDSTTAPASGSIYTAGNPGGNSSTASSPIVAVAAIRALVAAGRHFAAWLEYGSASYTSSPGGVQHGITGTVLG